MSTSEMEKKLKTLTQNDFIITENDYADFLDTLKNALIKMEEISFAKTPSALEIRIFSTVRQIVMGLLYHLPENSVQTMGLNNLNQKIRERETRFKELLDEKKTLRQNLDVVDSDISALEKEAAVLTELNKHQKIRSELMESCESTMAWQEILDKAATRVPAEREKLERLSAQIKELFERQKEILRNDLKHREQIEKTIESNIFR